MREGERCINGAGRIKWWWRGFVLKVLSKDVEWIVAVWSVWYPLNTHTNYLSFKK